MKKKWITVVGAIVLVIGVTLAGVSFANSDQTEITAGDIRLQNQSEAQFPSLAKISLSQAVQKGLGRGQRPIAEGGARGRKRLSGLWSRSGLRQPDGYGGEDRRRFGKGTGPEPR